MIKNTKQWIRKRQEKSLQKRTLRANKKALEALKQKEREDYERSTNR